MKVEGRSESRPELGLLSQAPVGASCTVQGMLQSCQALRVRRVKAILGKKALEGKIARAREEDIKKN
jgi:hypothetical protein